MNEELLNRPLGALMRRFCIPCIVSLLVSCLYSIIDQIFVGNGIGYTANAATGIIFPLTILGLGISLWSGDGSAAAYSLNLGRNPDESIRRYVTSAVLMTLSCGLVFMAVYFLLEQPILHLLGAQEGTMQMAQTYGWIIMMFMPVSMLQNALAPLIRAAGSPGYALAALCAGAILNIISDYLTVFVWQMGIAGAAWATISGQILSLILCLGYFAKRMEAPEKQKMKKPDMKLTGLICRLGLSSFISQISIVLITVLNNILLVHYGSQTVYGPDIPLAAFVVLMKLFQVVICFAIGIAAGGQPIAGVNYSAGKYSRVRMLLFRMCAVIFVISAASTLAFELFPRPFVAMFGADDPLYVEFAIKVLRIYLSMTVLTCLQRVCAIFMQSIGQAVKAAFLSLLRDGLLAVFSLILPLFSGLDGIFFAAPCADLTAFAITVIMIAHQLQTMKNLQNISAAELKQSGVF